MELMEELESVKAIFGDEVSYSEDRDGTILVNLLVDKKMVATFVVKDGYPHSQPDIQLSLQFNFPELENCVLDVTRDLVGSPMLFQMIEAVRDWVQSHPNHADSSAQDRSSPAPSSDSNVCRFFKQGKCKFGDKCKFLHPEKGRSPAVNNSSPGKHPVADQATVSDKQSKHKLEDVDSGAKDDRSIVKSKHEETEKKTSMRQATDVISRILWDGDLPTEEFCIGYLDRFVGIIEKPFSAFSWEDIASVGPSVLSVPKHRIQYFKYRDQIVWDKRSQEDNFFGSRGGSTIDEIVKKSATAVKEQEQPTASEQEQPTASEAVGSLELSPHREVTNSPRTFDDKDRPTHFLCIRITDQKAVANIQKVQNHITKVSPQLADGCLPSTAFHVTLCMVRLENEDHTARAIATLDKVKCHFLHLIPRCVSLTLSGVDNFRDRLVYIKVVPNSALCKLVSMLIERLQMAGLSTPGNHSQYTPHVTIVKLSRPMQRELDTGIIGPALYSSFQDSQFGQQQIQSIHLCSMTAPKQEDGFYLRLHSLSNSFMHLMPEISLPLLKTIELLFRNGSIKDSDRAKLTEAVTSSDSHVADEERFEQALKVLSTSLSSHSQEFSQNTTVVILRGVPGSGKSFLASNFSAHLSNPSQLAICSADEFFLKDGVYKFVPELVPEAHLYCLQNFLRSLFQNEIVIVDNTNSQVWEYQIYCYLCKMLHLEMHIIEIPCPTDFIAEKYRSRNLHNIDCAALSSTVQRWETDDRAKLVPPKFAYPTTSANKPALSLQSIVHPESFQVQLMDSSPSLFAVYTGIFLTTESQWLLVSTYSPAFPNVSADHVTLCFKPTPRSIEATRIGERVKIRVTGHLTNSGVQAVRVQVPNDVHFDVDHPHITVSTDSNVSPRMSSAVLSKQQPGTTKQVKTLTLEGTLGLVVRQLVDADKAPEADDSLDTSLRSDMVKLPTYTVTSKKMFLQYVAKKLYPEFKSSASPLVQSGYPDDSVSIHTGTDKITDLFLFDFDGTLFHSPYPEEGKAVYEKHTGKKWPHKGWWSCPESLLPPLEVSPGPSIADFRCHFGCAGSLTVVLTSRINRIRSAMKAILEHASIFPDQIIMKPDDSKAMPGHVFKGITIRQLLTQFPDVVRIKFWDDKEENLLEVERVAKLTKNSVQVDSIFVKPSASHLESFVPNSPSPVSSYLEANLVAYCHLPSTSYSQAAQVGVEFLAQQFSQLLNYRGDPNHLVYPFGSFPLGRSSDIDLCLIAPPSNSPMDLADKLATHLDLCGLKFIHVGRSSRCPRLKVSIHFNKAGAIDYDVVFAVLQDDAQFDQIQHITVLDLKSMLKPGDSQSKAAFAGPVFLKHIENAIQGTVCTSTFAAVVEMVVQILRAKCLKGNAFHCIRTFHIIQLLTDFIKSRAKTSSVADWTADTLFKEFVISCSQLPTSKWTKLFGEFVPHQYIKQLMDVFSSLRQQVEAVDFPSSASYVTLRKQTPFPLPKHTTVQIRVTAAQNMLLWKLTSVVEAKLPSYIRKMLDSGLTVIPGVVSTDETTSVFQFAVPDSDHTMEAVQQICRPFWSEISEYRQLDSVSIELVFQKPEDHKETKSAGDNITQAYTDLVTDFCSSNEPELHLSVNLNSYERRLVHEAAERMNIEHKTIVNDGASHVVLRKKPTT